MTHAMKRILAIAALSAALISPALAEPTCFETSEFIKAAREKFGELPMWHSLEENGLTVVMVMNPETQTWGIVKGDANTVCLVITGVGFIPFMVGEPS